MSSVMAESGVTGEGWRVVLRRSEQGEGRELTGRRLVLAAGALGWVTIPGAIVEPRPS